MTSSNPELIECGICGSTHIEEVEESLFYYYSCVTCGHQSEGTLIQNLAPELWNEDPINQQLNRYINSQIRELKNEIIDLERSKDSIDEDIYFIKDAIRNLEKEMTVVNPVPVKNNQTILCA